MAKWRLVSGPHKYAPSSFDRSHGWVYKIVHAADQRKISVEVAGTVRASDGPLPAEVQSALSTRGKSAVEAVLDHDTPPRRLLGRTHGIAGDDE